MFYFNSFARLACVLFVCALPKAFAYDSDPNGDLLLQCESEAMVLDVRSVDGQMLASLNYKESANASDHVGSVVPVEKTATGVAQCGHSYPKKGSYCSEPTLPVRKFVLNVSGNSAESSMTLGYQNGLLVDKLSCWGILANSLGPVR